MCCKEVNVTSSYPGMHCPFYLSCADFGDGELELLLDVVDVGEGEGGEVIARVPPDGAIQLLHLVPHPCHLHKYLLQPSMHNK